MIVVDCSLVMAGVLDDECEADAERILSDFSAGVAEAIVPAHFYLECSSVLISALRRKRLTLPQFHEYRDTIQVLPLTTDHACIEPDTMKTVTDISIRHNTSVYDAAYLEIAIRKKIPLATLDKRLIQAAADAGLPSA